MIKNINLPSASRMMRRALYSMDPCIVAIDSSGFWVLPASTHRERPTVITMNPKEFTASVEMELGEEISKILAREDVDTILQGVARKIFQKRNPLKGECQ